MENENILVLFFWGVPYAFAGYFFASWYTWIKTGKIDEYVPVYGFEVIGAFVFWPLLVPFALGRLVVKIIEFLFTKQ